jgi:oligopeptide/dipeptide ABC transporter ATP-binding protein
MYAGQVVEVRESAKLHEEPLHPYTAALSAARPRIDTAAERLIAIPGRPLSAFEAPTDACPFVSRCPFAQHVCEEGRPPLVAMAGGLTRCVRAAEIREELRVVAHG